MKYLFLTFSFFFGLYGFAQTETSIFEEIKDYQESKNEEFSNPETTILTPSDFKNFKALEYYPINTDYRVVAQFVRTPNEKPFLMPTTTDRLPEYVKYGEAHFEIDGKPFTLTLYKSTNAWGDPEKYGDQLFLPFTDLTSGDGAYGGGRYMDVKIPEGDTLVIDFNKTYNPYCAYNPNYSCPIPPKENDLKVRIEAGIKDFKKH